ncbi:MAG: hypothetical protein ILA17_11940 [Ruminococcus sp.]|nr:hypothetical protein [Ruminococcus sp.]
MKAKMRSIFIPTDPLPKPFNDFSVAGVLLPPLKSIREFRKESMSENFSQERIHSCSAGIFLIKPKPNKANAKAENQKNQKKCEKGLDK